MNKFTFASLALLLISMVSNAGPMEMETSSGIRHISGGVGGSERRELAELGKGFKLKLTFAEADGAYRFDIPVSILTADNEPVITTESYGPLMYVDVPPGEYIIIADDPETGQLQRITVKEGGQQASLVFRASR